MKELKVLKKAGELVKNSRIGEEVVLFGIQHLTPTTVSLFESLINQGLKAENIYLMGKCYSANPINFHRLSRLNIHMASSSFYFDSHRSYDDILEENAHTFFSKAIEELDFSKVKKIILLDDGATLLSQIALNVPSHVEVCGIEQTSGGYNKAVEQGVNIPIINVARSEAKLIYETPFICRMVCKNLTKHMMNIPFEVKKVLIIGSGYIGRKVHQYLSKQYEVTLIDKKDEHYCENRLGESLNQYDLIIGCTGKNSLSLEQLSKINRPIALISASSSDREFPAVELRKQIERYHYFSKSVIIGHLHLINSGFPVNFDDQFLDSYELELTRALLFLAVIQSAESKGLLPGFYPVHEQKVIIDYYLKLYSSHNEHLDLSLNESFESEIHFPYVFKLIKSMTQDAFKTLEQKIKKGFSISERTFTPFLVADSQ